LGSSTDFVSAEIAKADNTVAEKSRFNIQTPRSKLIQQKAKQNNTADENVHSPMRLIKTVNFNMHEIRRNITYQAAVVFEGLVGFGVDFVVEDVLVGDHEGTER